MMNADLLRESSPPQNPHPVFEIQETEADGHSEAVLPEVGLGLQVGTDSVKTDVLISLDTPVTAPAVCCVCLCPGTLTL